MTSTATYCCWLSPLLPINFFFFLFHLERLFWLWRIHSTIRMRLRLEIIDLNGWLDGRNDDDCICLTWLDKSELKSWMKDKKSAEGKIFFPPECDESVLIQWCKAKLAKAKTSMNTHSHGLKNLTLRNQPKHFGRSRAKGQELRSLDLSKTLSSIFILLIFLVNFFPAISCRTNSIGFSHWVLKSWVLEFHFMRKNCTLNGRCLDTYVAGDVVVSINAD